MTHIKSNLLVIWDGSTTHRGTLIKEFLAGTNGRLQLERLPAYAPELNPVEYLWGHWKHHKSPNYCPMNFGELSSHAKQALRRMHCRPNLITAFWKQAKLF